MQKICLTILILFFLSQDVFSQTWPIKSPQLNRRNQLFGPSGTFPGTPGKLDSPDSISVPLIPLDFPSEISSVPSKMELNAKVESHAISVMKKIPFAGGDKGNPIIQWGMEQEGTRIFLLVQVPDNSIMTLDERASRLTRFSDDKNTNLLQEREAVPGTGEMVGNLVGGVIEIGDTLPPGHILPPKPTTVQPVWSRAVSLRMIDPAGKWILIDCFAPICPAPGAQTITLEGEFVLQCGGKMKTITHKNIPLDGSGGFFTKEGFVTVQKTRSYPLGFAIGGEGNSNFRAKAEISLSSKNKPVIRYDGSDADYTFFDSDGNKIESRKGAIGGVHGSGGDGKHFTIHSQNFYLAKEVDSLTIQREGYEKNETVTVPFSLKVGLGL